MAGEFSDHLATLCEEAGVAADDINVGSKATVPYGEGPYVAITDTGGTGNLRTHNSYPGRAYDRPSAQIRVHAEDYTVGMALAKTLFTYIEQVRNRDIDGVWYQEIMMIQSAPFDMGLDDSKRPRVAFNAMAVKRPS
jgi:hypothetical protein